MQVLVLGAGQLAQMMSLVGAPLDIHLSAYDVHSKKIIHPLTHLPTSFKTLTQAIEQADVITSEFEHVPLEVLSLCQEKLSPHSHSIHIGGNRVLEKELLSQVQAPCAPYYLIHKEADLYHAIELLGLPLILKTSLGGYDGKGQWRLNTTKDIPLIWQELAQTLLASRQQTILAESLIPFSKEVSIIGARHHNGLITTYPLTQNIHQNGVLRFSRTLTSPSLQEQAESIFRKITSHLQYVGVLAIEFFVLGQELLVNEIAPRVHNSGHWTQDGSDICQFESHLRAITHLAHPKNYSVKPSAMINILGQDKISPQLLSYEQTHVHWYNKQKREGRKMGHINVTADTDSALQERLLKLAHHLDQTSFPHIEKMILESKTEKS